MKNFKDCPCDICLVSSICNQSCIDEIIWYAKLDEKSKDKYIERGMYKRNISREAAEYIVMNYQKDNNLTININ